MSKRHFSKHQSSKRTDRIAVVLAGALATGVLACTWVPLTAAGEQVQLANQKAVESCEQIGKTVARTSSKVWIFARDEATIREELQSLARNDAAELGGTTVAPLGPAEEGVPTFGIYTCQL